MSAMGTPLPPRKYGRLKWMVPNSKFATQDRKMLHCGLSFFLCVHGHTLGYVRIVRKYKSLFEEFGIAEADQVTP